MSMSSPQVRKLLIGLICIFCFLLIILCVVAAVITLQLESFDSPSTGGSSQSTSTSPTIQPGTSSSTVTVPGTTTVPTVPTSSARPTTPIIPPVTTTKPTVPTTKPTVPTTKPTEPTTKPTEPTTKPTEPTTKPTEPTTKPTEPTVPFDEEKFFSESVFIGDSITLGLQYYCNRNKTALHGAKVLCAGSYAVRFAIDDPNKAEISITYQGNKIRPEDALAAMGAKRVFIMLGLNDIGYHGIDKTITDWGILVKNIRAKCPDIEIYIQSGTPLYKGKGSLNNTNMDKYNVKLEQFCKDNGCFFVNVAETLKDSQGVLQKQYCSDDYCHLTDAGLKAWIAYLKSYAAANHQ